jgi:signal transduction histidine kinase
MDARPSALARIRAALAASPLAVDVAIAVGLALLSLGSYAGGSTQVGPPGWVTVALLLLESLPLIVRRRFPALVLAVIGGATLVHIALLPADADLSAGLGILVAIYTVGERLARRTSLVLTAVLGVSLVTAIAIRVDLAAVLQSTVQTLLILAVAWLLGDSARIRRLYAATLEERALLLEREREERAAQAVREERQHIARELHDVVTHHVSVIVIQAGGAARVLDKRPGEARLALEAIAVTGRQALTDMRRMLGILGEPASAEPMPGLDQLGTLVDQVRAAGLDVALEVTGEARPLDPGLEVSAYRIVQEALTNSLKHARGGRAHVSIGYRPDALDLAIDDVRGSGGAVVDAVEPPHEGRGIVGMRERVAMLRGTFRAEATPSGFRVTARLPVEPGAPA